VCGVCVRGTPPPSCFPPLLPLLFPPPTSPPQRTATLQKGEDGRDVAEYSPELNNDGALTFFGNRMCPYCDRVCVAA
jgi:hypothetical protein